MFFDFVRSSQGFGSRLKPFSTPASENKIFATTFAAKLLKQRFRSKFLVCCEITS